MTVHTATLDKMRLRLKRTQQELDTALTRLREAGGDLVIRFNTVPLDRYRFGGLGIQRFEARIAEDDLLEALKLRQLCVDPLSSHHAILIDLIMMKAVAVSRLSVNIGYLEEYAGKLRTRSPASVLNYLACLGIEHPTRCYCHEFNDEPQDASDWFSIKSDEWDHNHHHLLNRAVWELSSRDPGMMAKVRSAAGLELRRIGQDAGPLDAGPTLRRYQAENVRQLLLVKPQESWFKSPSNLLIAA